VPRGPRNCHLSRAPGTGAVSVQISTCEQHRRRSERERLAAGILASGSGRRAMQAGPSALARAAHLRHSVTDSP
jgi:hypothetical protein